MARNWRFAAMVNGQSQLGLMIVDSGDWKILTTNRDRGLLADICWSPDGSQIFFDRVAGGPLGIYQISKYGGEERLVLDGAMCPKVRPDGSILLTRRNSDGLAQSYLYSPETEQIRALNAIPEAGTVSGIALLADGSTAVFHGRRTNDLTSPKKFWRIDLNSGETQPFLTNASANIQFRDTNPFTF